MFIITKLMHRELLQEIASRKPEEKLDLPGTIVLY